MSHAASYIFFLILILLNILNPDDNKQEIDLNWYNYLMPFFSLGFLFIDVEQMLDHARAVKIGKRVNCLEATVARIRGFFGNKYFAYRFLGNACFIVGYVTEYLGYEFGAEYASHLGTDSANNSFIDDDEANYVEFHPVKIGVCLQGIAIVILITHLLTLLCLHSAFGAVYVGLFKCIGVVFSFTVTFGVIILAFSLSIYAVLRNSRMKMGTANVTNATQFTYCSESLQNCYTRCNISDSFHSFSNSLGTLLWNAFEPGDAEPLKCSEGATGIVGGVLWYLYNLVASVVLVNLLIALMGVIMSEIKNNRINTWKYQRLFIWTKYCGKKVLLPPPMNILDILVSAFTACYRRLSDICAGGCHPKQTPIPANDEGHEREKRYRKLIHSLATKYASLRDCRGK